MQTPNDFSDELDEILFKSFSRAGLKNIDDAKAKLTALLRRVEVEAKQGASEQPQSGNKPSGKQVVKLHPYLNENGKKYWLTLTQDIRGDWNVGYSLDGSTYLEWSAIGENHSIDEALGKLAAVYKEQQDVER